MAEELETVLRLVAEGKLTPEEAAPIIEALTRAEQPSHHDHFDPGFDHAFERGFGHLDRLGERIDRKVNRRIERAQRRVERRVEAARARVVDAADELGRVSRGRQLRIKVTERGRQVVNLRIPIGFVDTALTFVPGLGGDQAERIREAVRAGAIGPILDVEDPDGQGGVLISVE
jgi:polyhydroxyalkanoate synthesis regulator phasin